MKPSPQKMLLTRTPYAVYQQLNRICEVDINRFVWKNVTDEIEDDVNLLQEWIQDEIE